MSLKDQQNINEVGMSHIRRLPQDAKEKMQKLIQEEEKAIPLKDQTLNKFFKTKKLRHYPPIKQIKTKRSFTI